MLQDVQDNHNFLFLLANCLENENNCRILIIKNINLLMKRKRRRNELFAKYFAFISPHLSSSYLKSTKTLWMKVRCGGWWEDIVLNLMKFDDTQWIQNFRMDRKTFLEICSLVNDDLRPKPAFLSPRVPLSTEKQVAIAIYKLASCAEMRVVGNCMGVSVPTVHKCVRRFTIAMMKHATKYIYMPSKEEALDIARKFEVMSSIPQILMVIDGTHIPVLAPTIGCGDFKNRKGWTSFNVQVTADADYVFRDVSCQFPGATHDAYVFKNSGLFLNAEECIPKDPKLIDGVLIDYFLIGDPAYPLLNWLIKGFSGNLSPQQESFNAYLNSARIVIEQSIGKLKSRWRILKKYVEMDHTFVPKVIIVCCMLHNIVQKKRIPVPQDVMDVNNNNRFDQPDLQRIACNNNLSRSMGEQIRNKLLTLTNKKPLRKQIVLKRN